MDGYITKCNSGRITLRELVNDEARVRLYIDYTQKYDAVNNISKFVINRIYTPYQMAYSHIFLDGKISVNGTVVYTASATKKNAVAHVGDKDALTREVTSPGFPGSMTYTLYASPFRTQLVNDDLFDEINDSCELLSPEIEIPHDSETRSAEVKIEFLGNSSSSFFIKYVNSSDEVKETISKNRLEGALVSQDNGCTYTITYGTIDDKKSPEYFLFGNDYPDTFQHNCIQLSGATIQQVLSAADVIAGEKCAVGVKIKPEYFYRLILSCGVWQGAFNPIENVTLDGEHSILFDDNLPLESLYGMPNAPKAQFKAILKTFLDDDCTNLVGDSKPVYFYVLVPSDVIPSITDSSATVVFTNEDYNIGEAIAEYSHVNLLASAEGIYGSSIEKFIIQGAYNTEVKESNLNYIGDIIKTQGLKEFTIIAVDSRGMRSESKQYFIQFYKYDKPRILTFDAGRTGEDGTSIFVRPGWEISSINGKNTSIGTIKFKKKNESAWRTLCEIANNSTEYVLISNPDDADGLWDKYYSYEFMLVVQDLTKNYVESIKFIPTIKTIMDFREPETKEGIGGVGIGKMCELENFLEVWLNAKFFNDIYIGDIPLEAYVGKSVQVTLKSGDSGDGWTDNLQTVAVKNVTADQTKSDVIASPAEDDDSYCGYTENGVRLYAQMDDAVQFKCENVPTTDIKVNLIVRKR